MTYNLFKFLHIASAIVWLGSVSTLTVLNTRLGRDAGDISAQAALARESTFVGRRVVGPAAGLTLVAGVVAALVGSLDMGALWISWGFTGLIISMALSGTLIRRTTVSLETALAGSGLAEVSTLRDRLTMLNLINLLVLLSVVAAMVFKPTL